MPAKKQRQEVFHRDRALESIAREPGSLTPHVSTIRRQARVPYGAGKMLALVNDIERYPEFLYWCRAARIERASGEMVDAALDIGIGGIHKTMRTRNCTSVEDGGGAANIRIEMLDGPLKRLVGDWNFRDRPEGGCEIELKLDYEVHRTPFGMLLRTVFDEIASSQLNAFIRRAHALHGRA
jgi:ribosome-associated toxin RatA of RatAB toxin-antitoxin module